MSGVAGDGSEVTLPGTETWTIESSFVDQQFEISVAVLGTPDGGPYPVLYLLDANATFAAVAQIVSALQLGQLSPVLGEAFPNVVLVGIGYPIGAVLNDPEAIKTWGALRSRDLTPPGSTDRASGMPDGGAPQLLRFITDELMPEVNRRYPTDRKDCGILGQSLGGRFVMYAMLTAPTVFRRYVAASPGLDHDRDFLHEAEAALARDPSRLHARLFLGAGALERDGTLSGVSEMADQLRASHYEGLELTTVVLDGETHVSGLPGLYSRGLRAVYLDE